MNIASSTPLYTGSTLPGALPPLPSNAPVFDAENVRLQRWMRFNPLRSLDPENLSLALDQFEVGILRQAALLWDAMLKRDDTLSFAAPQLENAIAARPWGVFKKKGADPREAARHAAALEYFYDNVIATDAFDRNVRGDRHLLLRQMGTSHALRYAVHHFQWRRDPGRMIDVPGAEPVPALTATMEAVPLWFFENTTGTLRFLPFGGFGIDGLPLNWDGEWMVTTGTGIMFAASICYVFKRLTFQDWTIFNERYAQQKVVGQTTAQKDSAAGRAMAEIVAEFNSDQGIVVYETQPGDKPPLSLLGPTGTGTADLFEKFLDRQDRKMAVMFRGSDLRNMSRKGHATGVSAQNAETEALEIAHCAAIASACRVFIDRAVIKYCFGEGVQPLAYFGLPETSEDDLAELRNSAGFLADRGAFVDREAIARRLGVTLATDEAAALHERRSALSRDPSPHPAAPADAPRTSNNGGGYNPDEPRADNGRWIKARQDSTIHQPGETLKYDEHGDSESRGRRARRGNRLRPGTAVDAADDGNKSPDPGGSKDDAESLARGSAPADAAPSAKAVRALQRRLAKAEEAASRRRDADPYGAARKVLAAARAAGEIPTIKHRRAFYLASGGEHHVEHEPESSRVIKHTRNGLFGFFPEVDGAGYVTLRRARASEYMTRMDTQKHVFDSDFQFEGSHAGETPTEAGREHEQGGFSYSQRFIAGTTPDDPEVTKYLEGKGYHRVSSKILYHPTLEKTSWFHPVNEHFVGDAKPENFKRDAQGNLHALDLIVVHAPKGSALRRAVAGHLLAHTSSPSQTGNTIFFGDWRRIFAKNQTSNVASVEDGGWAVIAPYGEHLSPAGDYLQHFDRLQAEKVIRTWNSITGKAARAFKNLWHGLGPKFSTPVWDGHPETDQRRWPVEKLLAEITDLRAGPAGLEGRITWNSRGLAVRSKGPLFPSPLWWHQPPAGDPPTVYPELLESVGLVPAPNIPGVPAWTHNSTPAENIDLRPHPYPMNEEQLLALRRVLGLSESANSEACIDTALTRLTQRDTAQQTANTAQAELDSANARLAAMTAEVESLCTSLLDLAERQGAISPAERVSFAERLTTPNTAATVLAELPRRQALNTRAIELNGSRIDLSSANARANALQGLVQKRMKDENLGYDDAFSRCQQDPACQPLFAAMQQPSPASAGI